MCQLKIKTMSANHVFVTVGTTKFDELIKTITREEILELFVRLGYKSITLQIGNGLYEPKQSDIINIQYYRLKSCIKEDIRRADLVISHAGAGSCLEILGEHKPLIVVINESLMGNHQLEIAIALSNRKYLHYTTCQDLQKTLTNRGFEQLQTYIAGEPQLFAEYLDKCVGFSSV